MDLTDFVASLLGFAVRVESIEEFENNYSMYIGLSLSR